MLCDRNCGWLWRCHTFLEGIHPSVCVLASSRKDGGIFSDLTNRKAECNEHMPCGIIRPLAQCYNGSVVLACAGCYASRNCELPGHWPPGISYGRNVAITEIGNAAKQHCLPNRAPLWSPSNDFQIEINCSRASLVDVGLHDGQTWKLPVWLNGRTVDSCAWGPELGPSTPNG